jgi:dTDP-4-amino-4,6-dideoxygalactose transaminase
MNIPFNKPYLTGKEAHYMYDAIYHGKLSGNGKYTKKCQAFFEERYGFKKTFLTTSCTDALEMAALLIDIGPGDEVIVPSFTFVSTANAFVLRGAKIVFADSKPDHPNIDEIKIEALITSKTKAIVPVHYAGVACDMDVIMEIAYKYNLYVIEDAAQAVDSYYKGKPLGSIGHFGTFSFHETKNIISGEGGLLAVNDQQFIERAEIIWEKGTNRSAFWRGEVDKYNWVDVGSSFLPSETVSSFLWAQLENLKTIQNKRITLWNFYYENLKHLQVEGKLQLPEIYNYATNNAHMFYLVCNNENERTKLIEYLKAKNIMAVFHYMPLHNSPYYTDKHNGKQLINTVLFSDRLVRLPLYYELSNENQRNIIKAVNEFFEKYYL